jgi:hypothetical protein
MAVIPIREQHDIELDTLMAALSDQELVALYSSGPGRHLNPAHVEGLKRVAAKAWDEGFDAGELDVMEHWPDEGPGTVECIPNPYVGES